VKRLAGLLDRFRGDSYDGPQLLPGGRRANQAARGSLLMPPLDEFRDVLHPDEPLAPLTWFRLGGPAEFLARPRDHDRLRALVARGQDAAIPLRVLSGGSNVLVRDEGVPGIVIHLESPAFADVRIEGRQIEVGAAVPLTALISQSARAGLAGLETLTGIPGTVGGALRGNAGSRQGAIGQFVRSVRVLDAAGNLVVREKDDLSFGYRWSNLDDPIILGATLELEPEDPESVVKRMRRIWILKKENQPYGHQSSGLIFKDPAPDVTARMLIEQSGMKGARHDGAEVSDRHANFIVAQPGATASGVRALIDQVRTRVAERTGFELELQIQIW
jgi:UDP-N-acetylmuramate dehydrogenase